MIARTIRVRLADDGVRDGVMILTTEYGPRT